MILAYLIFPDGYISKEYRNWFNYNSNNPICFVCSKERTKEDIQRYALGCIACIEGE